MFSATAEVLEATVHQLGNHALVINGEIAQSRCYVTAWHWSQSTRHEGPLRTADFVSLGAYGDTFARVDETWRFSHRQCHLLGPRGLCIGSVTPDLGDMMKNTSRAGMPADILPRPMKT